MAHPFDERDETPLDPAVERVQARLRRLIAISGLTLGLGLFAVFAAILYRIVTEDASAPAAAAWQAGEAAPRLALSDIGLPADARLITAAVDGDRLLLTYAHTGGNTLVLIDAKSLAVIGTLALEGR